MNTSAIIFFALSIILVWGGLGWCLSIAVRK